MTCCLSQTDAFAKMLLWQPDWRRVVSHAQIFFFLSLSVILFLLWCNLFRFVFTVLYVSVSVVVSSIFLIIVIFISCSPGLPSSWPSLPHSSSSSPSSSSFSINYWIQSRCCHFTVNLLNCFRCERLRWQTWWLLGRIYCCFSALLYSLQVNCANATRIIVAHCGLF